MDTDAARARLEELGLSDNQIVEVLPLLGNAETPHSVASLANSEEALREELKNETDPARRVVLAARIISASLS